MADEKDETLTTVVNGVTVRSLETIAQKAGVRIQSTLLTADEKRWIADRHTPFLIHDCTYVEKAEHGPCWLFTILIWGQERTFFMQSRPEDHPEIDKLYQGISEATALGEYVPACLSWIDWSKAVGGGFYQLQSADPVEAMERQEQPLLPF